MFKKEKQQKMTLQATSIKGVQLTTQIASPPLHIANVEGDSDSKAKLELIAKKFEEDLKNSRGLNLNVSVDQNNVMLIKGTVNSVHSLQHVITYCNKLTEMIALTEGKQLDARYEVFIDKGDPEFNQTFIYAPLQTRIQAQGAKEQALDHEAA